jgi:Zn ribbon nucleic-acid-binding protein
MECLNCGFEDTISNKDENIIKLLQAIETIDVHMVECSNCDCKSMYLNKKPILYSISQNKIRYEDINKINWSKHI